MYKIKENQTLKTALEENHFMKIEIRIAYGVDKCVGF
jgi:hypothetical protein